MSIKIMSAVWDLDLGASEKLVLLALADNANDEGACWPSITTLMRKCGKGERSIQIALRELETAGHIDRVEVSGKGCRYIVHPRRKCTPAENAPVQKTTSTPAENAPHPRRKCALTIIEPKEPSESARATRLPEDFEMPEDWLDWAVRTMRWDRHDVVIERDSFIDYWHSKPGAAAKKLDWLATWRNWCRNSRRSMKPAVDLRNDPIRV